jgi:Flp pilus assembly protein TadD
MSIDLREARSGLLSSPTDPNQYTRLGFRLHQHNEYSAAIRCYQNGLLIDPENDNIHCLLGLTYHNLGEHEQAIAHYKKATELKPSNHEAHYYLGFILIQEQRINEAIQALRTALTLNQNLEPAYHYLSMALTRSGKQKEAIRLLKRRLTDQFPAIEHYVAFTLGDLISGRRKQHVPAGHADACVIRLLRQLRKESIHVFGDSHRSVFNGLNNVICHNVGAGTAYNLIAQKSSTGAGSKILRKLKMLTPEKHVVLLVFGEIDCMEHLHKNAFRTESSLHMVLNTLVDRYLEFTKLLIAKGYDVLIYGPSFSGTAINSHGGLQERNWLVRQFCKRLGSACEKIPNLLFASLQHLLVNEAYEPWLEMSGDGRHLDHFPRGSSVFQGIIFSQYLEAAQSRADRQALTAVRHDGASSVNHGQSKPFALFSRSTDNQQRWSLETGVIHENYSRSLHAYMPGGAGFFIDLLDHVLITSVTFTLSACSATTPFQGTLKLTVIHHQQTTLLKEIGFNGTGHTHLEIAVEPTIARGVLIHLEAAETLSTCQSSQLTISELYLDGPYDTFSTLERCTLDPA